MIVHLYFLVFFDMFDSANWSRLKNVEPMQTDFEQRNAKCTAKAKPKGFDKTQESQTPFLTFLPVQDPTALPSAIFPVHPQTFIHS